MNPRTLQLDISSWGANIRITAATFELYDWSRSIAERALVGRTEAVAPHVHFASIFHVSLDGEGRIKILQDGELVGLDSEPRHLEKFFNSLIRVAIAENAPAHLFMHAGAVGRGGTGIIFPGTSFVGKSTVVAELVKAGAEYYSDDYAVFDREGKLHAFPRILSMRKDDEKFTTFELSVDELGGTAGDCPIDVGAILLTRYEAGADWGPRTLTPGEAVLEMMQYTFGFAQRPDFSIPILNKIASRAIILSGSRGPADNFAKTLLDFVDKREH